jgi:hypothetical protein
MNEFLLIFRQVEAPDAEKPSPEQMQATMKLWMDWLGSIAAQDKLVSSGNRLYGGTGSVVRPGNVVTNGPYVEIKELIGGYSMIKCDTLEEATEISKGCPILQVGGNVEVRQVVPMNM